MTPALIFGWVTDAALLTAIVGLCGLVLNDRRRLREAERRLREHHALLLPCEPWETFTYPERRR